MWFDHRIIAGQPPGHIPAIYRLGLIETGKAICEMSRSDS
jgi:hypothetical protein